MSWLDKVKYDFTIYFPNDDSYDSNTGTFDISKADVYTPKWINATHKFDVNYTEFIFKGVPGSLIDRRLPKGERYEVELYFDSINTDGKSQDNLDIAAKFAASAKWVPKGSTYSPPFYVAHPMYGTLYVQHLGFDFDNSDYNVTKITGTLIETLTNKKLNILPDFGSNVAAKFNTLSRNNAANYNAVVTKVSASDIISQAKAANAIKDAVVSYGGYAAKIQNYVDKFNTAYNTANAYINMGQAAIDNGFNTIGSIIQLAFLPVSFTLSLANRVSFYQSMLSSLNFSDFLSLNDKVLLESMGITYNACICVAAANPSAGDYNTVDDVTNMVSIILGNYNSLIAGLESMQGLNGGELNAYIPNPQNIQAYNDIVLYTVSQLYQIAASTKKKYTVSLAADDSIFNIAYRYVGLTADDSTIDDLAALNNLSIPEWIILRKGRQITYYA
jgi:hypothetical protein